MTHKLSLTTTGIEVIKLGVSGFVNELFGIISDKLLSIELVGGRPSLDTDKPSLTPCISAWIRLINTRQTSSGLIRLESSEEWRWYIQLRDIETFV